ncbi:MAG: hypothetical protein KDB27_22270, partial [Planctomycetales bacterium]|nr:hypothetical protein [Planctomycetales bacterium]
MSDAFRGRKPTGSAFFVALCFIGTVGVKAALGGLSSQQIRMINQELAPAFIDGDLLSTANLATQLAKNTAPQDRKQVDTLLQQNGVVSLDELTVSSRMELMRFGYAGPLAEPTESEIVLLLDAIAKEIDLEIAAVKKLVTAKSSDDLEAIESQLWHLHVAKNRLFLARQMSERGVEMAMFNYAKLVDDESKDDRDKARKVFETQASIAGNLQRNVDDQAILLRLERISLAEKILQESQDFEQRLLAAWVADSDGAIVEEFFRDVELGKFVPGKRLSVPGIAASARANLIELQMLAGPQLLKMSRDLFVGLHWWLRGRYGAGPHGFGLIKDQTAMISGERLFGLYMPAELPTPTSPYDD